MHERYKFKSIQAQLAFWFILSAVVPLSLVSTIVYLQRTQAIKAEATSKLSAIRNLKVAKLNQWLDERLGDLGMMISAQEALAFNKFCRQSDGSFRAAPRLLAETRTFFGDFVRNYPDYEEVFLLDGKSGIVLASSNRAREGSSKLNALYFTEARRTRKPTIRDIYYSNTTKAESIAFSAPILCKPHQGEHVASVLVARVDVHRSLYKLLSSRIGLGETGETLIVNKGMLALNQLRWSPQAPLRLKIRAEPALRAAQGETGVVQTRDYRGKAVLAAYTYIPRTRWGFVAKQDISEIYAPIYEMLGLLGLVMLLTVFAAAGCAWLLAGKIARPAIRLAETADRLRAGDLSVRSGIQGPDEFGRMAASFDAMANSLTKALSRSESTFKTLWDSATDGMAVVDFETHRVLSHNKRMHELLGYSDEEMSRLSVEDLHPQEDLPRIMREFETLAPGSHKSTPGIPLLKKDGTTLYADINAGVLMLDGRPCVLEVFRDATERRAAAAELESSEREWRELFDVIGDAITVQDMDCNILSMNKAAQRMLGGSDGILKQKCFQHYHGTDAPSEGCPSCAVLKTGRPCKREVFEPHLGKYLRIEAWPRFDAQHRQIGLLHVVKDISPEKKAQSEMERIRDQFHRSQKLEATGQLAAGIAHDFNNILTGIGAYASFIKEDAAPGDSKGDDAGEICDAVKKAALLTHQLLAFGRKQLLKPEIVDLNAIASDAAKLFKRTLPENIKITTRLAAELDNVKIDPRQLEHVLLNLALNARDAMPEGGELILATSNTTIKPPLLNGDDALPPGDYAALSVSDTGVGMSAAVRTRVFEPFFTTKTVGRGTGLGLASAYGIIKQSGGYLSVRSEPGKGTAFEIFMPITSERAETQPQERNPLENLKGSETVLLVEDDPGVRRTAGRILKNCGYEVLSASDGKAALRISRRLDKKIDLMITDVMMPGINGVDLAKEIRSARPKIDLIFISGYTAENLAHQKIFTENSAFLHKPFEPRALAVELRRVLDKA